MKIDIKSKALLYIDYFEKQEENNYMKIDEIRIRISRKDFIKSLEEDKKKGINHTIEYVNEKPKKFCFGVFYILKTPTGRPDYIYTNQIN